MQFYSPTQATQPYVTLVTTHTSLQGIPKLAVTAAAIAAAVGK